MISLTSYFGLSDSQIKGGKIIDNQLKVYYHYDIKNIYYEKNDD